MTSAALIFGGLAILLLPIWIAFARYGWGEDDAIERWISDMDLREFFRVQMIVHLALAAILLGFFVRLAMRWAQ